MVWSVKHTQDGCLYFVLNLLCLGCGKELGPYVVEENLEGCVEGSCSVCNGMVEYVSRGGYQCIEIYYELEFEDAQR